MTFAMNWSASLCIETKANRNKNAKIDPDWLTLPSHTTHNTQHAAVVDVPD